jgi:predicted amidophosphoribosyltransferase
MEGTQKPPKAVSLSTQSMSEAQIRRAAGLCICCGMTRETDPEEHYCDQCTSQALEAENKALCRRWNIAT